jgi:hypothetical protein
MPSRLMKSCNRLTRSLIFKKCFCAYINAIASGFGTCLP